MLSSMVLVTPKPSNEGAFLTSVLLATRLHHALRYKNEYLDRRSQTLELNDTAHNSRNSFNMYFIQDLASLLA
jgi:hypothetical protein